MSQSGANHSPRRDAVTAVYQGMRYYCNTIVKFMNERGWVHIRKFQLMLACVRKVREERGK